MASDEDGYPSGRDERETERVSETEEEEEARSQNKNLLNSDRGKRRRDHRNRSDASNREVGSYNDDAGDGEDFGVYRRRNAVESDDSLYEPDSEEQQEEEEDENQAAQPHSPSLPAEDLLIPSYIKAESDDPDDGLPPLSTLSPRKRPIHPTMPTDRPFKRVKGPFIPAYVQLLNSDIEDAASQLVAPGVGAVLNDDDDDDNDNDNDNDSDNEQDPFSLPGSQIGLTVWSATEKAVFFEALCRLGADDAPGIARRVRSKSVFEVAQYVRLLREGARARTRAHGYSHARDSDYDVRPDSHPIRPVDVPAAVELGPACCAALEVAADTVALRQEAFEERHERQRWGERYWLVTRQNREALENDVEGRRAGDEERADEDENEAESRDDDNREIAPAQLRPIAELFRLRRWLTLPERIFMNAGFPEGNWRSVSEDPPAMRATALQDFYSLAVSVTRRLVSATLYVAESRIRSRPSRYTIRHGETSSVTRRDVRAAALSLGFGQNRREFWARCPRRLRLHVYDYDQGMPDDDQEPIPYDDLEEALELDKGRVERETDMGTLKEGGFPIEKNGLLDYDEKGDEIEDEEEKEARQTSDSGTEASGPEDKYDEAVEQEANEVLLHSALPYATTTRMRRSLKARIKAAHDEEAYVDALDARAAYREEKFLWSLLDKTPPAGLVKPPVPSAPARRTRGALDELYTSGVDWRENVQYINEWELGLPPDAAVEGGRG